MAINIQHSLDPALVGALSYVAGREQYRRRETDFERGLETLRQRLLNPEANQIGPPQQLGEAPDQYRPRHTYDAPDRPIARPPMNPLAIADIEETRDIVKNRDRIRGNLIEQLLHGRQRQDLSQYKLARAEAARQAHAKRGTFNYAKDSAEFLQLQARDVETSLAKLRPRLRPEGNRLYGVLVGKLRAIEKMRGFAPPDQYARLLGQWLEEYEASGIQDHVVEQPTIEQALAKDSMDLGTGYTAFRQPDGRIRVRQTSEPKLSDQDLEVQKERRQFAREQHLLDLNVSRITAHANWMKARPDMTRFMRTSPGFPKHDGTPGLPVQTFDEEAFNRALAFWRSMNPGRTGFGQEPGLPTALDGGPAAGDPLPAVQPTTPTIGPRGLTDNLSVQPAPLEMPVKVASQADLRAKIQSGQIPIGGRYEVNGVLYIRTR